MTPVQLQAALDRIGLSQRGGARFLEIDERTMRKWIAGEARIPEATAKLLRVMIRLKLAPEDVP
jgi:DNA-binding transcriptional regulator YiaG